MALAAEQHALDPPIGSIYYVPGALGGWLYQVGKETVIA
jgi:hypothetical protein